MYAIKIVFLILWFVYALTINAFLRELRSKRNTFVSIDLMRGFPEKGDHFWKTFCVGNLIQTVSLGGLLILTQ